MDPKEMDNAILLILCLSPILPGPSMVWVSLFILASDALGATMSAYEAAFAWLKMEGVIIA